MRKIQYWGYNSEKSVSLPACHAAVRFDVCRMRQRRGPAGNRAAEQAEEQTADSNSASASGLSSEDCSGQVLTWNLGVDSQTLDPAFSVSDDSDSVINNTFEGLMRNSGEGAQPAMAQDMPQETVNEDGTVTLTYTIREASWSDGQPVTAQDFEFAWKRCANPENNASNAYLMSVLPGYDDIVAGDATIDELGVKAVDDSTLEVTLKQPTAYFNELLTLPAFMPLREDMVGSDDSWSKDPTRTVSNGPFTLAGYTEGKELVLQKNENYWNKDNVQLDYIVARMLDEQMAPHGLWGHRADRGHCFPAGEPDRHRGQHR